MNVIIIIVLLIILFFVIRFMSICHKDFFVGCNKIVEDVGIDYPFIDPYYLLTKNQREFVDKDDKNILRDVNELMFKNSNKGIVKDIYDMTKVNTGINKMGFW